MPLTITLTPQAATASVSITVTTSTLTPLVLTRSDANGTSLVRLRAGQVPVAGTMTVVDYEPALTGPLTYDVAETSGAHKSASTTLDGLLDGRPRLTAVQMPQLTHSPRIITGYSAARLNATTPHLIVNRADPVVVLGPVRSRTGRMVIWCSDYADAKACSDVLSAGQVLILRQADHPGMDMTFLAADHTIDPLTERTAQGWRWSVTVAFTETNAGALPLLGDAGWTWDDLAAEFPTWAAVAAEFPTWNDVQVGP